MNKTVQPQWLEWTKELQFIAQGGLTYSKDVFGKGAVEAAKFLAGKPAGRYDMIDVISAK